MEISYFGHSSFRLKGREGVVITDPYSAEIGFPFPSASADIVTLSHDHADHNNAGAIKGTSRREHPFVITQAGEYEVGGISVFGHTSYHDAQKGAQRGRNIIFRILMEEMVVCHLGDLGHELSAEVLDDLGQIDILLCPVGGVFTIDPEMAAKVVRSIEPSVVIPMHYRTARHGAGFAALATVDVFAKELGRPVQPNDRYVMERGKLPEELQFVVLSDGAEPMVMSENSGIVVPTTPSSGSAENTTPESVGEISVD